MKEIMLAMLIAILGIKVPVDDHSRKMISTPINDEDLLRVIKESYANVHGKQINVNLAAGAWAHISLENNHGKKVWNRNLGNIGKLPEDPEVPYYSHFGKTRYRSFSSFVSGGEAYWKFIERCPDAVRHFEQHNPRAAGLSLKRCNYYRSDEEQYSKTLSILYGKAVRRTKNK